MSAVRSSPSCTGLLPSLVRLSCRLLLDTSDDLMLIRNPDHPKIIGLASSHFARRYFGNRCFFLFLRLLRCFSSPGYLLMSYGFTHGYIHITVCGFPHSEICGSMVVCTLPQLIAACHVLLRLLLPRHPPYALCFLTCCLRYY